MDLTRSEELFEALCRQDNLPFCRIARRQGTRTPDYLVGTFFKRVVVEVKQLDPNPQEQKLQEVFDAGKIVAFGGTPGARVRKAIDDAYPQLRARTWLFRPGLLVLYDNIQLPVSDG